MLPLSSEQDCCTDSSSALRLTGSAGAVSESAAAGGDELADVLGLQPVDVRGNVGRADAGDHHPLDVGERDAVLRGEFPEAAVNRSDRVRRLDEQRLQQLRTAEAADFGRAAAHVYPDYNFHSVFEPSCFCYTVLLYTVSRALSRDKPFCIFVKNRVFLFPFAHFYDMI